MADNNSLKILIQGVLDDSSKAIADINTQLKTLSTKLDSVKLKVEFGDIDQIKELQKIEGLMEKYLNVSDRLNKVLKEEEQIIKNLDGTTEKLKRQHYADGTIREKTTKIVDKNKQALREENNAIGEQIKLLDTVGQKQKEVNRFDGQGNFKGGSAKYREGFTDTTYNVNDKGNVISKTVVNNIDQENKATNKLAEAKQKLTKELIILNTQGKITGQTLEKMTSAVNTRDSVEQLNKLNNTINVLEKNSNRKSSIGELVGQSDELKKLSSSTEQTIIDALKLNNVLQDQKIIGAELNRSTGRWAVTYRENGKQQRTLRGEIDQTTGSLYKQGDVIKDLTGRQMSFISQMGIAIERTIQWSVAVGGYYAVIRAIQNMTQQVIELDTALTSLSRVTDMNDSELEVFLGDAISLSDELSNKLSDVLSIAEEFSRFGFKEEDLLNITKTAQVLQNISDLSPQESVDALTSAMLNFNVAGEDSIRIADALNEVDRFCPLCQ